MQTLALVVWAIFATTSVGEASPVAGGSGYGLYFSAQRADVASFRWRNPPNDAVTVEFWLRKLDRHTVSVPFSYSVWNSSTDPPTVSYKELSMMLIGEYGVWKVYQGGTITDCPRVNCTFGWSDDWHHIALVHNAVPGAGYFKLYRDGNLVFDSSKLSEPQLSFSGLGRPGVFVFGQVSNCLLSQRHR